jgi:hypothetical protein
MENEIIGPLELEETDLATHTKLCHMRYIQIINKFDSVNEKFDKLESLVLAIKNSVDNMQVSTQKDYLKVSLYIIGILISALSFLVVKFVI